MRRRRPPDEILVTLRGRLEGLPARSPERQRLILGCADLHGVSIATIYRALRDQFRPRALHRSDRGRPRKLPPREMERFCELVAAIKLRTTNLKNRHLSTGRAIELLVEHGIETPEGLVRAPPGLLTRTTVNRYLRHWGLDDERRGRPPPARRFQAEHANDCWQFDLSPSDLKQVPAPLWMEAGQGPPTLMLFSAVDDRSGVAYQEYRCVYGEDVAAALRFLFNAMAPKDEPGLVLQGIPAMLYLDNGPVAKSATFRRVMAQLGVDVHTHMPRGSDGRRVTARSKGKSLPRRRPGSSGRSARSRKRTRRSIISTRRKTRPKPIFGCAITWFATTPSHTARNRVRAPRTGYRHCRKPACGRCAPGIGSAPSPASLSAGASASMPVSKWMASATRLIPRWPARR
jgi:hypothetical protein